ncbi:MAG: hypothetical protein M5R36_12500 [Deltaproteobacteria bacterium]|nr:hypothetical protein [Deltaproteobacteria bacterium]
MGANCPSGASLSIEANRLRQAAREQIAIGCPHCRWPKTLRVHAKGLWRKIEALLFAPTHLSCTLCEAVIPVELD